MEGSTTLRAEDYMRYISEEMIQHYHLRTTRHCDLVRHYCYRLVDHRLDVPTFQLTNLAAVHDATKFHPPEYAPYVLLTWRYKCKREHIIFGLPAEVDAEIRAATTHHIRCNPHHPDYFESRDIPLLNPRDRDKPPAELVDATAMPLVYIAEMVADWCAMAEEMGNTPRAWADRNVNIRWKFNDDQVKLIYSLINTAWRHGK